MKPDLIYILLNQSGRRIFVTISRRRAFLEAIRRIRFREHPSDTKIEVWRSNATAPTGVVRCCHTGPHGEIKWKYRPGWPYDWRFESEGMGHPSRN